MTYVVQVVIMNTCTQEQQLTFKPELLHKIFTGTTMYRIAQKFNGGKV